MTSETATPDTAAPRAVAAPRDVAAPRAAALVAFGLAVAGLAHVPPTSHHLAEAPYAGAAFVGFTLACVALLLALSSSPSRPVLLASGVLCAVAIGTYAATRLVAFPGLAHDVGDWLDPYGVVSVAAEALVVAAAARAVR